MSSFIIPLNPISQPRPRTWVRSLIRAKGRSSLKCPNCRCSLQAITSTMSVPKGSKIETFRQGVALFARTGIREKIVGPVELAIDFFLKRPQTLMRQRDPSGPIWHAKEKDLDNLVKGVKDELTLAGAWDGDGQVCWSKTRKFYTEKGGQPRVEVSVQQAPGERQCPEQTRLF